MARQVKEWNRHELKYLVPHARIDALVEDLGPYIRLDPNSPDERGYPIYSVYADSPQLTFFWEKIEGLKFRRKVRFRRYGDDDRIWLEIKQRIDRTVQKRRVAWPMAQAEAVFFGGELDESALPEAPDPVTSEILFLWRLHGLRPTLATSYRRRAYSASNETDLRITFDSRVRYDPSSPGLTEADETSRALLDPTVSILEVKYSHTVPLWLVRMIQHHDLPAIRMSKYCSAIDRQYYGGQLT